MPKIDQIIRSKRKTIALVVQTDGTLIVRAPLRTTKKVIKQLVQQQEDWILKKQAEMLTRAQQNQPKQFVEKEEFYYLGHLYPLMIVNRVQQKLEFDEKTFRMTSSLQPYGAQVFKEWYRVQAKRVLTERVVYYAKKHGFQYKKVRITSASSRWGSYSTSGTLSFPWRLVMAPMDMIDYVVVHELVHSRFQNHSKDFWNGVAAIMPDYKERRKWFKQHGGKLFLEGVK